MTEKSVVMAGQISRSGVWRARRSRFGDDQNRSGGAGVDGWRAGSRVAVSNHCGD